ncbi:M50 family metallopeptidase [Rheinheimera soli]|uniref:Peptide zinc metalloprotease protein n=1 Tax=Rheinheimera soli TaxID=443616 RepID=A0ABU1W3Q7_9GAMM|nr:M50 family metallopeptidase [Rheinheimera soli]MDR7122615.1 putative peptide zinc metalloprotease protein [Rheinheimera soli]
MVIYRPNKNLQLSAVENSDDYLCTVQIGNRRRSYVVNSAIAAVIEYCKTAQDKDDIEAFAVGKQYLTKANFDAFFQQFLVEKNILLPVDGSAVEPAYNSGSLKFKLRLLPYSIVNSITGPLLLMFRKEVAACTLVAFIGSLIYLAWFISSDQFVQQTVLLTPLDSLYVIALISLGLVFHELGHAAAAYKYGCRRVDIGVGWYIYFIVFYAELSEAWQFGRRKRVIIDCAGGYFQSIFGVLLWLLYLSTDNFVFLSASALLALYSFFNLNPFFRMDGYWIASDLLNVKNLRYVAYDVIKLFFFQPKQLLTRVKEKDSHISKPILIYASGMLLFYIWFSYYVYSSLFPNSLLTLYNGVNAMFTDPLSGVSFTLSLVQLLWHLLIIYFVVYFSAGILKKIIPKLTG